MITVLLTMLTLAGTPVAPQDYAACRAAVLEGKAVTLAIGYYAADYHTAALDGFSPGVYRCYKDKATGLPMMEKIPPTPVANAAGNVGLVMRGIVVNAGSGSTYAKAQAQANAGRCYHPGGSFAPGAMAEGCGMSPVSAQHAIEIACLWNSGRPVVEISVVQGRNGYWHSCVNYR